MKYKKVERKKETYSNVLNESQESLEKKAKDIIEKYQNGEYYWMKHNGIHVRIQEMGIDYIENAIRFLNESQDKGPIKDAKLLILEKELKERSKGSFSDQSVESQNLRDLFEFLVKKKVVVFADFLIQKSKLGKNFDQSAPKRRVGYLNSLATENGCYTPEDDWMHYEGWHFFLASFEDILEKVIIRGGEDFLLIKGICLICSDESKINNEFLGESYFTIDIKGPKITHTYHEGPYPVHNLNIEDEYDWANFVG